MSNKRFTLLPVWAAVSAVIILAGIVLMAVLGFNNAPDLPESKTFDVHYNVVVDLNEEAKSSLAQYCEDAFAAEGVGYVNKATLKGQTDPVSLNQGAFTETGNDFLLRYTFAADVSDEALAAAKTAVEEKIAADEAFSAERSAEAEVSFDTVTQMPMNEAVWRGAVAVAVAAVVALLYVALRFGIGSALTGLAACVNDAFLTLAVFAVFRIPVYAFAPMLYAAVAAAVSVLLWLIRCMKLRDDGKEPGGALSAEEGVVNACRATDKLVLILAGILLAAVAVCAACTAGTGAAALFAGALVSVAAGLYSSMLLAPALHVRVKAFFDGKKRRNVRYEGKKKAAKAEE